MPMRSTRRLRLLAVCNGQLFRIDSGRPVKVDEDFCDSSADVVFSDTIGLVMYFVDGTHYLTYDAPTNTTGTLTATAGSLPTDLNGRKCRLMAAWQESLVLAGLASDPHNFFVSRQGTPTDFAYGTYPPDDAQAAFSGAEFSKCPDVINGIVPFSNDVCVFLCDHTLYQFTGRLTAGGSLDRLSDVVGGAWGRAFCTTPDSTLFFFGNRGGVWQLRPGGKPTRISQAITDELSRVNVVTNSIAMNWDDRAQAIHLWITPYDSTDETLHYTFEFRVGAWQRVKLGHKNYNPKVAYTFDGDAFDDRRVLLGSWDGRIRYLNESATQDDGYKFESYCTLGPLTVKQFEEFIVKDLVAVLGETSGEVDYEVRVGYTPEAALTSTPVLLGTWKAGRNTNHPILRSGHAIYITLRSQERILFESLAGRLNDRGTVRGRSRG